MRLTGLSRQLGWHLCFSYTCREAQWGGDYDDWGVNGATIMDISICVRSWGWFTLGPLPAKKEGCPSRAILPILVQPLDCIPTQSGCGGREVLQLWWRQPGNMDTVAHKVPTLKSSPSAVGMTPMWPCVECKSFLKGCRIAAMLTIPDCGTECFKTCVGSCENAGNVIVNAFSGLSIKGTRGLAKF